MFEYYRNTLAKSNYEDYTINDWMQVFAAEIKTITRDQIYGMIQHPATDFINLGLSSIYSISDNSFALVPTCSYSFTSDVEITTYLNFN